MGVTDTFGFDNAILSKSNNFSERGLKNMSADVLL
jgi:hypothetical protein